MQTIIENAGRAAARLWFAGWLLMATAVVGLGFILDATTTVGHHLLLIAGGVFLGIGLGRKSLE